jgi:hypothetical protein
MGTPKTCNRCGRTGSHAFRRTPDGLYECTTTTACRARARRQAGVRQDGRGRLPKHRGLSGAAPGVAYVVGPDGLERELIVNTLHEVTELAVAVGEATKTTLAALGSRNVKMILVAASCLDPIGFRNEFALRCRQPKLSHVPVFVYGPEGAVRPAAERVPQAAPVAYGTPADMLPGLRRRLQSFEASA